MPATSLPRTRPSAPADSCTSISTLEEMPSHVHHPSQLSASPGRRHLFMWRPAGNNDAVLHSVACQFRSPRAMADRPLGLTTQAGEHRRMTTRPNASHATSERPVQSAWGWLLINGTGWTAADLGAHHAAMRASRGGTIVAVGDLDALHMVEPAIAPTLFMAVAGPEQSRVAASGVDGRLRAGSTADWPDSCGFYATPLSCVIAI